MSPVGKGTIIDPDARVTSNCVVGKNCRIRAGAVVGALGLVTDKGKRVESKGGVVIGDNVEVGANSVVQCGGTRNTVVGSNTFIGPLCNIGHDAHIGRDCIITGNTLVCGYAEIGNEVYIAPMCNIANRVKIGPKCLIGIGSLVLKNIPAGRVAFGHPAKVVRHYGGWKG